MDTTALDACVSHAGVQAVATCTKCDRRVCAECSERHALVVCTPFGHCGICDNKVAGHPWLTTCIICKTVVCYQCEVKPTEDECNCFGDYTSCCSAECMDAHNAEIHGVGAVDTGAGTGAGTEGTGAGAGAGAGAGSVVDAMTAMDAVIMAQLDKWNAISKDPSAIEAIFAENEKKLTARFGNLAVASGHHHQDESKDQLETAPSDPCYFHDDTEAVATCATCNRRACANCLSSHQIVPCIPMGICAICNRSGVWKRMCKICAKFVCGDCEVRPTLSGCHCFEPGAGGCCSIECMGAHNTESHGVTVTAA